MTVYSHSRLKTFEQCPQKFKFAYIDKAEVPPFRGIEGYMGQTAHKTLETLYRALSESRVPTREETVRDYHRLWREDWGEDVVVIKKQYTAEDYRRTGERCVADYYDAHAPFSREGKTLGLEHTVLFALDDTGQYQMKGVIDRMSERGKGEIEIHDYKTTGNMPRPAQMDADRQLPLYHIAAEQNVEGMRSAELVWHFLAFKKEVRRRATEEQLRDTKRWAISAIRKIESANHHPPVESALCNWCEFQGICPAKVKG